MGPLVSNKKLLFFVYQIILLSLVAQCYSNEILGCGGFVKSHVNLDFSKIEIGLYTKEGILKEKTECAPTNGYYFLPMYEHGEYILKVHPPAGWSFEPSQVELVVDGETDQCSTGEDINFAFNGFGITGRVITAGQSTGPSGITVQLVDGSGHVRETVSSTSGDFHFTPVIPGKYTLKASHSKWKLEPAQAVVQVKEGNTALPVGVLAVKGYEVGGLVTSFGSPIAGIYVLLYSKVEKQKFRVEGCNTALLQGVPDSPICHSVTDASGEFQFGLVPAGEYKLLALSKPPGQAAVSYNIQPDSVPFSVKHDNIYIKNAFEVTGFTVVGSVLNAPGGEGMSGVRVLFDGTPVGTTDATGKFTLPSLKPGLYTLTFQHEQCEVEEVHMEVGARGPAGAVVGAAARWRVCGQVSPPEQRRVQLAAHHHLHHVTPQPDGTWCTFLAPGTYTAKVEVSEEELRDGLQWYPASRSVVVGRGGGVTEVTFSQVRARVRGRVVTHDVTPPTTATPTLRLRLRTLAPDGGYASRAPLLTTQPNDKGEYEFSDVVPGSVEVSVESARLCWADSRHNVAVAGELALVPPFEQAGYLLHIVSDQDIEVRSAPLHVKVCRKHLQTVEFRAVAHAAVVRVTSPDPVSDLVLHVVGADGSRDLGPLTPVPDPAGGYVFEHTLYLADGEEVSVRATSATLLVSPRSGQRVRGAPGCGAAALQLQAARGLTLAGRLLPPVADVLITLRSDELVLTQVTGEDGTYRFGPLERGRRYAVSAQKDSYVFGERDEDGNIVASKLAEILVELQDEADGKPLEGALVSVSGGEYRRTAASDAEGRLRFVSLAPAQYYVRPHLKEYRLRPPHATLTVPPHTDDAPHADMLHTLRFTGVRVAWSVWGSVVSLNGAGVAGAGVRALPVPPSAETPPPAHCVPQDATASLDATFRIRGLMPNCFYKLELKESSAEELSGLRLAKAPPVIEMKEQDVQNVRLIAIQRVAVTDGGVVVRAPAEYIRTL
ncbi:PREDICTED: nodal modulator 1, partial [Papilio xuthus]|uniref:Nodal modulator 1 n=1 Tax=Papilio xuthus TaxID=66420 RepID=A0AAJ6ZMS9_PAPXU